MLKYIIFLCCLVATQAEAIKARKRLSPDVVKICIAKDVGDKLEANLDENHKYLERMLKIHNATIAIATLKRDALKKWKLTRIGYSFRSMSNSRKLMKPYEPFLQELIENSADLEAIYEHLPENRILIELYHDTKGLISQVKDFKAQRNLEAYVDTAFRHALAEVFSWPN